MEPSPATRKMLEKIMDTYNIPFAMREMFIKQGAKAAEPYATKNGHHFIKPEDAMEAVRDKTPPDKRAEVIKALEDADIDASMLKESWDL